MIGRLAGTILEKAPDHVLLDVAGVGYLVAISFQTFQQLPGAGMESAVLTHTHVREDSLALYGFATPREKTLFELLIGVAGVGPKLALTILSGIPADELVAALEGADVRRLTAIPGIGRKTAERLTLELKDKVARLERARGEIGPAPLADDVISALVNFGYRKADAERAAESILRRGAPADFSEFLKSALSALSGA